MSKTLVVLRKTRDLTVGDFKKNFIDEFDADLCLCGTQFDDPFYPLAKYIFLYETPPEGAVEHAYLKTMESAKTRTIRILQMGSMSDELFFRWVLLNHLKKGLIDNYNRFVFTDDALPHPKLEYLNENCIWIGDGHAVLSKRNIEPYLNVLHSIVLTPNKYRNQTTMEQLTKFHLEKNNAWHLVKPFPTDCQGPVCIRKKYNVQTPVPLRTLDVEIIKEFELPFRRKNMFINGVNTNSYNQVPDICKNYMTYVNNRWELKWSKEMIDAMLQLCERSDFESLSPQDYPKSSLQFVQAFTFMELSGKNCLVLGSISPWVECLLLHFKAASVTTLDYNVPACDYKIKTVTMKDRDRYKYDVVVSFSSLEHDGLGRYGDPINPNGDIDACIEASTMLSEGGYFVCGIPIGHGCIEGNCHRIYNQKRLDKMFSLFDHVGCVNYQTMGDDLRFSGADWKNQPLFILKSKTTI